MFGARRYNPSGMGDQEPCGTLAHVTSFMQKEVVKERACFGLFGGRTDPSSEFASTRTTKSVASSQSPTNPPPQTSHAGHGTMSRSCRLACWCADMGRLSARRMVGAGPGTRAVAVGKIPRNYLRLHWDQSIVFRTRHPAGGAYDMRP